MLRNRFHLADASQTARLPKGSSLEMRKKKPDQMARRIADRNPKGFGQ